MFAALTLLLFASQAINAHPGPHAVKKSVLPKSWYHDEDHPARSLFRRQDPLPEVGSPEWVALYPTDNQNPEANIPQAWLDRLNEAIAAGRIPRITVPRFNETARLPEYGDVDVTSPEICSSTFECRADDDIWDGPDGTIGLSVDDGPHNLPEASARLYDYLAEQNQKVTHFMIGSNILLYPDMFMRAFEELQNDIAVHTWSHRMQSTLSDEAILADLGWTIQIIHDLTGGRLTRYWRPPYGDADNRVRAIAREVFGMTTVIWNADSRDWGMADDSETIQSITQRFETWVAGPRSPGLIVLEHEIHADDVDVFMAIYPLLRDSDWEVRSIAELFEDEVGWYLNAQNNQGEVVEADVGSGPDPTANSNNNGGNSGNGNGSGSGNSSRTTSGQTGTTSATIDPSDTSDSVRLTAPAAALVVVALLGNFMLA